MIDPEKGLHLKAVQDKLGMLFENSNKCEWLDEIRLTTEEAAAFLSISPNALRIKVHRGQVQAEKLGNQLRFKLSSLFASFKQLEV